jgi:STE24 endopeptidase
LARFCVAITTLVLLLAFLPTTASPQAVPSRAPTARIEVRALAQMDKPADFDAQKATRAYLSRISGTARERSDAYFEGGYVLLFVDAAYALAVSAILLWTRISAGMRNLAQRVTRSRFLQAPIYGALYVALTTAMTLPLSIYEGFFREHAYGLSNQTLLGWSRDFSVGFLFSIAGVVVVVTLIYAAIRRAGRNWWLWGTVISVAALFFVSVIQPVFIDPAFNTYKPLPDTPLKREILALAQGNGIPATDIYEFDASKQTTRISANVAGFMGTTRIAMNDNLMKQGTPAEIKAILGHEMGHYVLNHQLYGIVGFGLIGLAGFAFVNWAFRRLTDVFGGNWDVRTIDDPAGLPVLVAAATFFILLMTPVLNTITRTVEAQADIFGLNTARQPDGFATTALKLSTYRKLEPSALEEFVFYDHPSGRTRIFGAMRWKAAHLDDPDIKAGLESPQ